jgi:hypothetical protein
MWRLRRRSSEQPETPPVHPPEGQPQGAPTVAAKERLPAPNRARERGRLWAVKGLSMEKWLCWASMGVSGLLLLLFLLDLFLSFPFGGLSKVVDVLGILCCGMVLYLAWDAFKDLR